LIDKEFLTQIIGWIRHHPGSETRDPGIMDPKSGFATLETCVA